MKINNLSSGDWIIFEYGFGSKIFYIVSNNLPFKELIICSPYWLCEDFIKIKYKNMKKFYFIGNFGTTWYWKYLPKFMKNIFCPYNKPKYFLKNIINLIENLNNGKTDNNADNLAG